MKYHYMRMSRFSNIFFNAIKTVFQALSLLGVIDLLLRSCTLVNSNTKRGFYGIISVMAKIARIMKLHVPLTHDMLVNLHKMPLESSSVPLVNHSIMIRKPFIAEKKMIVEWIARRFNSIWAEEVEVALSNSPPSCFFAFDNKKPVGFACYDATALGYFGPTGVIRSYQGKGLGKKLLFEALGDMRRKGYGYAIIGGVGPAAFYKKTVGAFSIPDSTREIWADMIDECER